MNHFVLLALIFGVTLTGPSAARKVIAIVKKGGFFPPPPFPFLPPRHQNQTSTNSSGLIVSLEDGNDHSTTKKFTPEVITERLTTPETTKAPLRAAQQACEVYMKLSGNKIVGGDPADVGEFPWMAALGYLNHRREKYVVIFGCGGTLISEWFVLTARHCVSISHPPVVVRLGKVTLTDDDGIAPENRNIKEIIRHNQYKPNSKQNDIALIRMVKSVYFSTNIAPACLETNTHDLNFNVKLVETGWGYTLDDRESPSNILRKAQLVTMPLAECNEKLLAWNRILNDEALRDGITEGQYCTYDPKLIMDSCQGDSGGPVQYFPFKNSAISKIIGVISYGFGCATDKPGINTRVAYYLDWIESIVWPNGFSISR